MQNIFVFFFEKMKLLGVVVFLGVFGLKSVMGLKSYVEFHLQTVNCDNRPEITLTVANFTNLRPPNLGIGIEIYKSINVFGMWQIGRCFGTNTATPCTTGTTAVEFQTYIANQDTCYRVNGPPNPTGFEVRRLGDTAMSAPQLALFDRANFNHDAQMTLVTSQGLTSASLSIKSLFFTGNHYWTIYDEVDFRGRGRCLRPMQDVARRGYGFTTESDIDQTIRSVRFGCNGAHQVTASLVLIVFLHFMGKNIQL